MSIKRVKVTKDEIMSANDLIEGPVDFISTGSTVLNLAASCHGRTGGHARGRINNIVGDGSSGKTLLALEACAWLYYNWESLESTIWPDIKKLDIVYNNPEGVMDFPVAEMYGAGFNDFVKWRRTQYVEQFGSDFLRRVRALKKGNSLLYVLDSYDSLDSEGEGKAFDECIDKGKEMEGSYDLGKQKYGSKRFFKKCCNDMQGKDATLIIVSQTRERIGITFGKKKYRTGGDALNFYTHQVVWLYEMGKLKRQVLNNERVYGIRVKARYERNKTAKPWREAEFPIVFDYGVDDIRSMVEWIYGTGKKKVKWEGKEYTRDALIKKAHETPSIRKDLEDEVEMRWLEIEERLQPKTRKYE